MNVEDTKTYQELLHFVENSSVEDIARNWANDLLRHKQEVEFLHDDLSSVEEYVSNLENEIFNLTE